MAITKRVEETKIEVVKPFNHINVRTDTIAEEDGVEIGRSSHRHNIAPDISADDLSKQSAEVQGIAAAVHTDEIKTAYTNHLSSEE